MGEEGSERIVISSNGTRIKLYATEVIFPQARVMPDGALIFPRDAPAGSIQGYTRDPKNRNRFIPLVKKCVLRESFWRKVCGGLVQRMHCKHFDKSVGICDCDACPVRKES